jgi:hypothetical protein
MLLSIVRPSAAFGGFLIMALLLFDKPYSSVDLRLISLGCDLLLAGMSLNLAIQACRKVLKVLPWGNMLYAGNTTYSKTPWPAP